MNERNIEYVQMQAAYLGRTSLFFGIERLTILTTIMEERNERKMYTPNQIENQCDTATNQHKPGSNDKLYEGIRYG